jgi:hypothetical protein
MRATRPVPEPLRSQVEESSSFLKKRTKKLLRVRAELMRRGRSQNNQKFFASFFQKRSPSFLPSSLTRLFQA